MSYALKLKRLCMYTKAFGPWSNSPQYWHMQNSKSLNTSSESLKTWRSLQVQLMKLSISNTWKSCSKDAASTLGHQASEAKTEKGPLPALLCKERQLLNGRKTIRKCSIIIQEKPKRRNRCLLPNSVFSILSGEKESLVGTCKPYVAQCYCLPNHREVSLRHSDQ